MDAARPRYRTVIGATSLIVGPALMSIGDLVHPAEHWMPATQAAIVVHSPERWYVAHLLLFVGWILLVPGILALTELVMDRKPTRGYVTRLLMVVSVGALSAVFVFEMLLGRIISEGGDEAAAALLLQTSQSAAIGGAVVPALLTFFIGTGFLVTTLASSAGPFRWPALIFGLGALLILGEIVLAQVLLSQIGNILMFVAGTTFARALLRGQEQAAT